VKKFRERMKKRMDSGQADRIKDFRMKMQKRMQGDEGEGRAERLKKFRERMRKRAESFRPSRRADHSDVGDTEEEDIGSLSS